MNLNEKDALLWSKNHKIEVTRIVKTDIKKEIELINYEAELEAAAATTTTRTTTTIVVYVLEFDTKSRRRCVFFLRNPI